MKKFTTLFAIVATLALANALSYAQSCSTDLSDLFEDWDWSRTDSKDDRKERTENFELSYGVNWLVPVNSLPVEIAPVGFKIGAFKQMDKEPRLSIGASFSVHNYGTLNRDTVIASYERLVTSFRSFGGNIETRYRFFDHEKVQAYLGAFFGLLNFSTVSFARDVDYPCDDRVWRDRLHAVSSTTANYGVSLGLQVPLKSFYDRLSFELSYQTPGRITYADPDGVEIEPFQISYQPITSVLRLLSPQIGFSHFF